MSKKKHKKNNYNNPNKQNNPQDSLNQEAENEELLNEDESQNEVVEDNNEDVVEEAPVVEEPTEEVPQEEQPKEAPIEEKPQEEQPEEVPIEEQSQEEQPEEAPIEEKPQEEQPEEAPIEEVSQEEQPEDEPIEEVPQEETPEEAPVEEESEEDHPEEEPVEESEEEKPEDEQVEDKKSKKKEKKKEPKVIIPIDNGKKGDEFLENLDHITNEYRIYDYIDSGYPFFEYDLIDVLRDDLEKANNEEFPKLFEKVLNSELIRNCEVIGMFIYFAKSKNYDLTLEKIFEKLPDVNSELTYYFASLNAIKYDNKQLFNEFKSNLNKAVFANELLNYHKKYKVYKLFDSDLGYKSLKKITGLYKKKYKKISEEERRVILRDIFDIYGLSTFPKYENGLGFYEKYENELDDKDKEYALLRLAHNYVIHFEFKKAIKAYEKILSFTSDSYNAEINLMLAKNNVRIYGELTTKLKYYETEEYKKIQDLAVEYNLKAYTDRFERLINEIKSQERYETEYKMGQIRRIVSGFCYVLMVITLILGFFIKMKSLILAEGIMALIVIGIQFLTIKLKKRLIPIIVFSSIAILIFILSIILI